MTGPCPASTFPITKEREAAIDEFYEQEHQAWLDEQNAVISFHEIPQSEYFRAPDGVFWVYILSLLERGYRVQ